MIFCKHIQGFQQTYIFNKSLSSSQGRVVGNPRWASGFPL